MAKHRLKNIFIKKGSKFSKKFRKLLKSNITFDKRIARNFHPLAYYMAMASDLRNLPNRDKEKAKIATPRSEKITKYIENYKTYLEEKSQGVWATLKGIYNKNVEAAFNNSAPPINCHLLRLVASVPMLVVAYRKIRGNKGAITPAWLLSSARRKRLNWYQRAYLTKTKKAPDSISSAIFTYTSRLLKQGRYPWGASRRVYFPKPGKPGALRPITIPPFMDKVVQAAITMVLEAIYEPWFEKTNRSFGFRPSKGVHDAIFCITSYNARGLHTAIEGDIKSAYDKVNRQKLIEILSKRIKDRKFLELVETRLNYQFYDSAKKEYIEEQEGIPQGGIDSPYLWNIYMMEFDNFVHEKTNEIFDIHNKKTRGNKPAKRPIPSKERRRLDKYRYALRFVIRTLNQHPNDLQYLKSVFEDTKNRVTYGFKQLLITYKWQDVYNNQTDTNKLKYELMKALRKTTHRIMRLPATDPSKVHLRFLYCRYADDWILLNNAPRHVNEALKQHFKDFLWDSLKATLAEEKTLITDFRKEPAHFLGFEIRTPAKNKIVRLKRKIKNDLNNTDSFRQTQTVKTSVGKYVYALPDRQRLISRLHMKGYSDASGFPREVRWLSPLEPFAILERFNSVLRGLANYYVEFIKNPSRALGRWVYIIRYACLKTFAQKYKTSIKGIFNKFGYKGKILRNGIPSKEKTIAFTIQHKIGEKTYTKTWRLLTLQELIYDAKNINRYSTVKGTFLRLESGNPTEYKKTEGRIPSIKDDSYLDNIKWVNLRTQASLDLPCCMCGSPTDVEMHHVRAIRKTAIELIPETRTWEKVMALRNRKQIPVCRSCHINVIHAGKYQGIKLSTLSPKILYDNRLVHIESYIKVGDEYFAKSLEEKGWKDITHKKLSKPISEQEQE